MPSVILEIFISRKDEVRIDVEKLIEKYADAGAGADDCIVTKLVDQIWL